MSERINLAELRAEVAAEEPETLFYLDCWEILALIDTIEAARELGRNRIIVDDDGMGPLLDLNTALARFDFGDPT